MHFFDKQCSHFDWNLTEILAPKINNKPSWSQVMAWCCQATSHYLSQCWPTSKLLYGLTRPQWVNTGGRWWTDYCGKLDNNYNKAYNREISQIPQCIKQLFHNAPLCNRNVHTCAHFCYKVVHCGVWDCCIVGLLQQIYCLCTGMKLGAVTQSTFSKMLIIGQS